MDDLTAFEFNPGLTCEHPICRSDQTKAIRYVVIACPKCRCGETYPVCGQCYLIMIGNARTAHGRSWDCAACDHRMTYREAVTWVQINHMVM